MYFRNFLLRKTWLDQCLKSCVSQNTLRENISNGSKRYCNLIGSTFTIFINDRKGNYVEKSRF